MRQLLCIIVLTTLPMALSAQSQNVLERCEDYASVARDIMVERQSGRLMSEMMRRADGMADLADLAKTLVIDAYKKPAFRTAQHQSRAIAEFQNDAYLECVTTLKDK